MVGQFTWSEGADQTPGGRAMKLKVQPVQILGSTA